MIVKKFKKQDGSDGESYFPEDKEVYIVLESKIRTFSHPAIVQGKAVIIENHTAKVQDKNGMELFLNFSKGQKKNLDKVQDLTNKEIVFEKYVHKTYGKLLGCNVKKDTVKK